MKILRSVWFFIALGVLFLIVAAGATVYVWSLVQQTQGAYEAETAPAEIVTEAEPSTESTPSAETPEEPSEELEQTPDIETAAPAAQETEETPVATTEEDEIVIDTSQLTEEQKAAAEQFGIDVDNIVVTEAMRTCAVDAVGEARLLELQNGATPSLFEGLSLLGCFSSN